MQLPLLGNLSVADFLHHHWQKSPLFVPQAFPDFKNFLNRQELFELACSDEVISRLVICEKGQWRVEQGPFKLQRLKKLPPTGWSLLVQNLNHLLPEAADLFYQFNFLPYARLDDLMVSYAPEGGGVGPHFDSYDVFLIQGEGKKHWQINQKADDRILPNSALRIIADFPPEQAWETQPGDLLYLPPKYAHWGRNLTAGMTYSVGFRAPTHQEFLNEFLGFLQEKLCVEGIYQDPDLTFSTQPAQINSQMCQQVREVLRRHIHWEDAWIGEFLAGYLSLPKRHVMFEPDPDANLPEFSVMVREGGVVLDLKSQMLFYEQQFFLNGDLIAAPEAWIPWLQQLANTRGLPAATYPEDFLAWLYAQHSLGFLWAGYPDDVVEITAA